MSVLVLVVGLIAAACGDDGGGIFTTTTGGGSTSTSPGSSTTSAGFEYPTQIVEAYVEGCAVDGTEEFCQCTIDEFQLRLSLQDFLDLEQAGDIESNPVVTEIVEVCQRRAGGTTTTTQAGGFEPITDPEALIELSIADLEQYWSAEMPEIWDVDYFPVSAYGPYIVSEGDVPVCGGPLQPEDYTGNAFYCSLNDTVQWDLEGLIAPLWTEYGDFTVALVMAHEWGHAVQERFGFDDSLPTIVSELQADCLAGAWTGRIDREESDILRLDSGDLEEGMAGFLLIGDSLGTAPSGPNAHGNSFARLNAFFDGYSLGAGHCATLEDSPPPFFHIPVGEDGQVDLLYDEAAPLLAQALEDFWAVLFPQEFGTAWDPIETTVQVFPSSGEYPTCGGFTPEQEFFEGNAFYCPPDDYVAWDEEQLFPALYTEIGDMALGLVLATEWHEAVQHKAGLETEGVAATLQRDCLTGVWTAALTFESGSPQNPTQIILTAGDLDEGIAGFLVTSAPAGTEGYASAFQRFESFKDGFLNGVDVCGLP
jgi:predicted metalloprotease